MNPAPKPASSAEGPEGAVEEGSKQVAGARVKARVRARARARARARVRVRVRVRVMMEGPEGVVKGPKQEAATKGLG